MRRLTAHLARIRAALKGMGSWTRLAALVMTVLAAAGAAWLVAGQLSSPRMTPVGATRMAPQRLAKLCVELRSLKLYLQTFRDEGIFYEALTNRILDELIAALAPRRLRVETRWRPRGGMHSLVTAEYEKPRRKTATR